jgi:hypothetical protein
MPVDVPEVKSPLRGAWESTRGLARQVGAGSARRGLGSSLLRELGRTSAPPGGDHLPHPGRSLSRADVLPGGRASDAGSALFELTCDLQAAIADELTRLHDVAHVVDQRVDKIASEYADRLDGARP